MTDPKPVSVSLPRIDTVFVDPETGMVSNEWYKYLEDLLQRTGGDTDVVDGTSVQLGEVSTNTDANTDEIVEIRGVEIIAGNGLTGGGTLTGPVTIEAKFNPGWTPATGSGSKMAYAQYTFVTASATYTPTEVTALSQALAELSARVVALEKALWATEAIKE